MLPRGHGIGGSKMQAAPFENKTGLLLEFYRELVQVGCCPVNFGHGEFTIGKINDGSEHFQQLFSGIQRPQERTKTSN